MTPEERFERIERHLEFLAVSMQSHDGQIAENYKQIAENSRQIAENSGQIAENWDFSDGKTASITVYPRLASNGGHRTGESLWS